jgi:hypothetical protein
MPRLVSRLCNRLLMTADDKGGELGEASAVRQPCSDQPHVLLNGANEVRHLFVLSSAEARVNK